MRGARVTSVTGARARPTDASGMRSLALAALLASAVGSASADVHFAIDAQQNARPISRYIYGINGSLTGPFALGAFTRIGGNRLTAYNWENNASNAGTDYLNQNDDFLSSSDTPGEAVRPGIAAAQAAGVGILVTVPINGYVAADKGPPGDVDQTPNYLQVRFKQEKPAKGAPFTLTPDPSDAFVYQDEFVNWVNSAFPGAQDPAHPVFYCLDNEPDLWPSMHPRIHPDPTTYAELAQKTVDYAGAIKSVSPAALVFGPVNYGWYGYTMLQGAPDAAGRDFQEFWLASVAAADQAAGHRLVDVLDVHWYPEAQGGGVRVTGSDTTPDVVAARVQAPRSLWDPSYTETSWITQSSTLGPIRLIPRLFDKIAANDPGMKLAITEYNYGGGGHISGAIAEADVLGIFGREGVFAAAEWPLAADESFIAAAFQMYRGFDGAGGVFGDTSIQAVTDDDASSSVYASRFAGDPGKLVLVAINKTGSPIAAAVAIANAAPIASIHAYHLAPGAAAPADAGPVSVAGAHDFSYAMPAYSVSTLAVTLPEPCTAPVALAAALALGALRRRRYSSVSRSRARTL